MKYLDLKKQLEKWKNTVDNRTLISKSRRFKSDIKEFTPHLPDGVKLTERIYNIVNNIQSVPECNNCKNHVKFDRFETGYFKFCSVKCSRLSSDVKSKQRQTCLDRYGVENPMKSEEVKSKQRQTCLDRYGVENPSQSEEIKFKKKSSSLKKHGVEFTLQSKIIRETIKKTCLDKYGVEYASQSDKYKEKRRLNVFNKIVNGERTKKHYIPLFNLDEFGGVSGKKQYRWKCVKCGNEFEDHLDNGRIPRCLICYPNCKVSNLEKEIFQFCSEMYTGEILLNSRSIIPPYELDIFIPECNLAIEFNGNYWHTELNGKDKNYHLNKTKMCNDQGIELIHIFEDEWINKQDIVKSILINKFGKTSRKIYARKCEVVYVNGQVAKQFLFDNHLQGEINGMQIGLEYNGELVSLLTVGKPRFNKKYDLEILRFCNKLNTSVVGGLSKLVKRIDKSLISYVDLRWGNGNGYMKAGFNLIGQSKPNYWYVHYHHNTMMNRMKFQKHKLQSILETFDPNLTEWENMQLNGYDRIWDCGNLVMVKKG